ncbi:hypothetical protein [Lentzea sp. NPDC059081]|uniref:hypothetical protein n=1 Tax=Lentzea sp. NPDC059081 TaxID=3346719 RepID=UPI0036CE556B
MRRPVFGVLFCGLLFATAVAGPQSAAADPCRWIPHDLPLPADATYSATRGSSESTRFVVGETRITGGGAEKGLIWDNGSLTQMASPGSSNIAIHPKDVNNSAVVVGGRDHWGQDSLRAFRYRNGSYELLDTPATHHSWARAVNNLGDVVGEMWQKGSDTRQVVVWLNDGTRREFLPGQAVGISDDRKLVQVTASSAVVIDVASGQRTELPGGRTPAVFDNDRLLHFSWGGLMEWTTAGQHVATWEGGTEPYGRTSSGHVVFGAVMGTATLWQWGIRYSVDSAKQPDVRYYGDISDEGALIGTYVDPDGSSHPARWFWCG